MSLALTEAYFVLIIYQPTKTTITNFLEKHEYLFENNIFINSTEGLGTLSVHLQCVCTRLHTILRNLRYQVAHLSTLRH